MDNFTILVIILILIIIYVYYYGFKKNDYFKNIDTNVYYDMINYNNRNQKISQLTNNNDLYVNTVIPKNKNVCDETLIPNNKNINYNINNNTKNLKLQYDFDLLNSFNKAQVDDITDVKSLDSLDSVNSLENIYI